jgi:hypothetical protein
MSEDFATEKPIRITDLRDGRLAKYGIAFCEKDGCIWLTDMIGNAISVEPGEHETEGLCARFFFVYAGNDPFFILSSVRYAYRTTIEYARLEQMPPDGRVEAIYTPVLLYPPPPDANDYGPELPVTPKQGMLV